MDATLVTTHCEKEAAAATFKGGFGYHPLGVWCDNTSEMLAAVLRPGNAGSNTTADHIEVLTAAIRQVPPKHRRRILVRADGAGASHGLLDWLTALNTKRARSVEYSVGFAVTGPVRDAIARVPKTAWQAAIDAHGELREGGHVVELTGMLDLTRWPPGMRIIVRRERPHPGAQLSLFEEADRWRYQAVATNTSTGQLAFLEARHRAHARVEDRIRHAKDSGLGRFPSREQPGLDVADHHRGRPDRMAAAARFARDAPLVRAQGLALPGPARARPDHPGRSPTTAPDPAILALGEADRGHVRTDHYDPGTALTDRPDPCPPTRSAPGDPHHSATRQSLTPTTSATTHPSLATHFAKSSPTLMNDRG